MAGIWDGWNHDGNGGRRERASRSAAGGPAAALGFRVSEANGSDWSDIEPASGQMPSRIVDIDGSLVTDLFFEPESHVAVCYQLWVRRDGDPWLPLGPQACDSAQAHHWLLVPPLPSQTEFAYALYVQGCSNVFWRATIGVRQLVARMPDGWTVRCQWSHAAFLDDTGECCVVVDSADRTRIVLAPSHFNPSLRTHGARG